MVKSLSNLTIKHEPPFGLLGGSENTTFSKKWELYEKVFSIDQLRFTLEDLFRGFQIYGKIGSGKTSGSGYFLATNFLRAGFGGLVLCGKKEEAEYWRNLSKENKREKSFIFITPDSENSFNFVDYYKYIVSSYPLEFQDSLLSEVFFELITSISGESRSSDSFWDNSLKQLLLNLVTLTNANNLSIDPSTLLKLLSSLPMDEKQVDEIKQVLNKTPGFDDRQMDENYFLKLIMSIDKPHDGVKRAISYFLDEFSSLNEKTRSIITTSFSSLLEYLNREPLKHLFSGVSKITPMHIFCGAVIVVDLSVHEWRQVGRIANQIWKLSFQAACQNRTPNGRPVFLWADEAHLFISKSDTEFQSTARSLRCITVYLTQNISNNRIGLSDINSKDLQTSLSGNLCNIIIHQNSDNETNKFAMQLAPKRKKKNLFTFFFPETNYNPSTHLELKEERIMLLKSGGRRNRYIVEGYVFKPGTKFKFKPFKFHQKKPKKAGRMAKFNFPFLDGSQG